MGVGLRHSADAVRAEVRQTPPECTGLHDMAPPGGHARVSPMPGPGRRVANLFLLAALVGCVPSVAAPSSFEPPNATPTSTALPVDSAADSASASVAALPSASLQPTPSATPDPSTLELEATSCDGGVVLGWSPSVDPMFHHYSALRSPER